MLSDTHKNEIREFYARISDGIPGFRSRFGQRQMIGAIANTLARAREPVSAKAEARGDSDGGNIVVIEGKTGVGKTIGYLVPALIMAQQTGRKLVISTGTVALQEQLIQRDIPTAVGYLETPVTFAMAKGRGRYVCTTRLAQFSGSQGELLDDDADAAVWERPPEEKEITFLKKLDEDLAAERWNGDRDDLGETVSQELWARISTDSAGCSGRRCPAVRSCPYYKARNTVSAADVIVANHDLVLSCLASGSSLLPPAEETIFVFDEAHHLPHVAVNRFAESASLLGSAKWINRVPGLLAKARSMLPKFDKPLNVAETCEALHAKLTELTGALKRVEHFATRDTMRFAHGELEAEFEAAATTISQHACALVKDFAAVHDAVHDAADEGEIPASQVDQLLRELGATSQRLVSFDHVWKMLLEERPDGVAPLAKWISRKGEGDFVVHACPIVAAGVLNYYLWKEASAVVLTSATMTSLGRFDFFLKSTGLASLPKVTSLAVESPFDYAAQGEIVIPRLSSDPRKADEHTEELIQVLPDMLKSVQAGTLVLFASRRQMEGVFEAMPAALQADILMQGTRGRSALLDEHRARIDTGKTSILFGLAGLGEGLDLPGAYCEHVIVAKIPFAPPDSPMEEALSEWIEVNQGNPFAELTLPKASLLLTQWTGRLIRTEQDHGRITILDTRIQTKSYGRQLISGLPAFRRLAA